MKKKTIEFSLKSMIRECSINPKLAFEIFNEIREAVAKGDRAKFNELVKNHIQSTLKEWKGVLSDWDLTNELANNTAFVDAFGKEVYLDWLKWANEADPDTPMYLSETAIVGIEDKTLNVHSTKNPRLGKLAITEYEVIASDSAFSLLRINIKTGRKNQIRVQLSDIGHPIVGDKKYGCKHNIMRRMALLLNQRHLL